MLIYFWYLPMNYYYSIILFIECELLDNLLNLQVHD